MDKLTTEDEVRDALVKIAEAQDLIDSVMTRLENRLYDDKAVDAAVFEGAEDAGWAARNKVDHLAEVLLRTLATVSR